MTAGKRSVLGILAAAQVIAARSAKDGEQAGNHGAAEEASLHASGERGPAVQRVVAHGLDSVEDSDASAGEEIDVDAKFRSDARSERRAGGEKSARARNQIFHQGDVARIEIARDNFVLGQAVGGDEFERDVDAALLEVAADVLPEVRELQRGASGVGERLTLGVAVAEEIEHEAADRIRGVAAISDDIVPGFVAMNGLVLTKSAKQIAERLDRNFELARGRGKGHQNRMGGRAAEGALDFLVPGIEKLGGAPGVGDFVAKIVGPAAVSIDIVEMPVKARRKQPGNDAKIFVMMRGEPARVALRFGQRTAFGREGSRDFQFLLSQHEAPAGYAQGMTAVFNSPLRCFMCSKTRGRSASGISPVMKSLARTSPRAMVSSDSRMKRGV